MLKMYKPSNAFPEYVHRNPQQNNVRPNLATHKKGQNRIIIVTIVLSPKDKVGLRSTAVLHFVEQRKPQGELNRHKNCI